MSLKKKDFKNYNILVIGDNCTDKFIYGDSFRLAPEAPVPVFNPTNVTTNPGMAGNVARNIRSLGSNVILLSNDIDMIKTRYVDERTGQILLRVDENDKAPRIESKIIEQIIDNKYQGLNIDAIIISDYNKGYLDTKDIKHICDNNINVFVDTKKILGDWIKNASFIKINHVEYKHTELTISDLNISEKLIITLSKEGCRFRDKIFNVESVQIKDVSGAGDTFLSGLVLEFIRTKKIDKSIIFAQKCATVVVQKKGVATI